MSKFIDCVKLYSDGGCKRNPGPGAIAFIIYDCSGIILESHYECVGETTNNRAEYLALIKGLDYTAKHTRRSVICFLYSDLVIKQVTGVFRLKNRELRRLFQEVKNKERSFNDVKYQHLKRTNPLIQKVDRLVKLALEGR